MRPDDNPNKKPCCAAWRQAQMPGTDNEMYGRAVWWMDDAALIGCDLPEVEFCPWCGAQKTMTDQEHNEKLDACMPDEHRDS